MKLGTLYILFVLFICSCTKTVYKTRYHHFSNEFEVQGELDLDSVEVYHQIYGNMLYVTMINKSSKPINFVAEKSNIHTENYQCKFTSASNENAIFPNGNKKLMIDMNSFFEASNINPAEQWEIVIKTELFFTSSDKPIEYKNTYTLEKKGARKNLSKKAGTNAVAVMHDIERIDVGETIKGFFTVTGLVVLALLTAPLEDE